MVKQVLTKTDIRNQLCASLEKDGWIFWSFSKGGDWTIFRQPESDWSWAAVSDDGKLIRAKDGGQLRGFILTAKQIKMQVGVA